mmetsp:Transcript_87734/g.272577  ORF Transcript_87734/g.272577 Transcript_87734/m.272577 type:complete len:513 (+) Transcript_87734:745-2283(+)
MLRRRTVCALLQDAVQLSQSCHSPHSPSMQSSPQECVLHGAASLFTSGSQAAPPFVGAAATARLRRMRPPPQDEEHTDQSYHSPHWQSVWGHMPSLPMHGNASSKAPWHPSLNFASGVSSCRERLMLPLPQSAEQEDQLDQSESSHTALHGCVLHAFSCLRELSGQLPPWLGGACMKRVLKACPPSHSLLQEGGSGCSQPKAFHSLHSESLQGSEGGAGQPSVSLSVSLQRIPEPVAVCCTRRKRKRCGWRSGLHMDQSSQSPRTQSRPPHSSSEQALVSSVLPTQASPLCCDSLTTRRMRVYRPLPQVALQAVHSCQSEKTQGTGAGPSPQGIVSSVLPAQGEPPFAGCARTSRLRYIWPVTAWHWLHSDHSDRAQSTFSSRHSSGTCSTDWILGPLQGWPHSLLATLTLLSRNFRPVQPPKESYQSPQSPNWQSTGVHSSHFGRSGQRPHISSKPLQALLPDCPLATAFGPAEGAARAAAGSREPMSSARQRRAFLGALRELAILPLWFT